VVVGFLRRHLRDFFWVILVGVLAAARSLTWTNNYRSEARIMAADSKRGLSLGSISPAAEALGLSVPGGGGGGDAFVLEVLKSRTLMEYLLATRFEFDFKKNPLARVEHKSETLADHIGAKNHDRAVTAVRRMLMAAKDLKTGLMTVTVDTGSPDLSRKVNEVTLNFLNKWVSERNRTKGGAKAQYAAERRLEMEKSYSDAAVAFSKFLQGNRNYSQSNDPWVRMEGFRLEQEAKVGFQLLTNVRMMEEQAKMEEKDNMPVINIIDPPNEPIDKNGPGRTFYVLGWMLCAATLRWLYTRYGEKLDFRTLLVMKA